MCWHVTGAAVLKILGIDFEVGVNVHPYTAATKWLEHCKMSPSTYRGETNTHYIFKSQYQLGEFRHLRNEPKKDPTKCSEYCNKFLQHLTVLQCRLYDSTFHTAQQMFTKQYLRKTVCDTECSPTCCTFNTHSIP